tara:strand:- start:73760 stop:74122 length:363 start_codon:yes stop_codon:yes gene_type:complete
MEKDYNKVPVELTPVWWENQQMTKEGFIVIPDVSYDNPIQQMKFEEEGHEADFCTGVIVKASAGYAGAVGKWCHYKQHGPHIFHPFRPRFENGKEKTVEAKAAVLVVPSDIVIITDKQIF